MKKRRRRQPAPEPLEAPRPRQKRDSNRWLVLFTGILGWFVLKAASSTPPPEEDGLPAFARSFPRDPALDALVAAFEAGDYARVRREAPELAKRTESDAVRRAARQLRRRLDPDPVAVYMLVAAASLLVFLAGWYWLHPHSP